jgi:hypothetical protein
MRSDVERQANWRAARQLEKLYELERRIKRLEELVTPLELPQ